MPDLIRHPVLSWIPAFAGMTILRYLIAGVITKKNVDENYKTRYKPNPKYLAMNHFRFLIYKVLC